MYPVGRASAEGAGPTQELLAISKQARGRWGKPPIGLSRSAHLAEHRARHEISGRYGPSSAQRLPATGALSPQSHLE